MAAEPMQVINFHLGRTQNRALLERARRRGTQMADELRTAVDVYLSGTWPDAADLLDAAVAQAEQALQEMNTMLHATNRRAEVAFAELTRLRGGGAACATRGAAPCSKGRAGRG